MKGCIIIGIDCATDPKKRGIATAHRRQKRNEIDHISTGLRNEQIAQLVATSRKLAQRFRWRLTSWLASARQSGKAEGPVCKMGAFNTV